MDVSLYHFSKKKNSTVTPSSGAQVIVGTLREGCGILNPIIGFQLSSLVIGTYTYAYIADFSRYYFINNWQWDGALWWAFMEIDTLGSFKLEIGDSSCYVLRSAFTYNDDITDDLYPTYNTKQTVEQSYTQPKFWNASSFAQGTYVVGIIGQNSISGAVNYYALKQNEMDALKNALLSTTDYMGTTEITDELLKALVNPFQYIVSATWFPFTNIQANDSVSIKVGWWTVPNLTGKKLSTHVYHNQSNISLYSSTYAGYKYQRSSPYSKYIYFNPLFGQIEIDAQLAANSMRYDEQGHYSTTFLTDTYVDFITGNAYFILSDNNTIISYRQGKCGIPVQLGQITQNVAGAATGVLGGIGGFLFGAITGNVQGIINSAGSIMSGIQSAQGTVTTNGVDGGLGVYQMTPYVSVFYNEQVDENIAENGKPLCETRTIKNIPGYIKTMNADIVIDGATDREQEAIRNYMNEGFFYE